MTISSKKGWDGSHVALILDLALSSVRYVGSVRGPRTMSIDTGQIKSLEGVVESPNSIAGEYLGLESGSVYFVWVKYIDLVSLGGVAESPNSVEG